MALKGESILQLVQFFYLGRKKNCTLKSIGLQYKVSPCSGGVVGPSAAYTVQKTTFLSVFECFPACCDDYRAPQNGLDENWEIFRFTKTPVASAAGWTPSLKKAPSDPLLKVMWRNRSETVFSLHIRMLSKLVLQKRSLNNLFITLLQQLITGQSTVHYNKDSRLKSKQSKA